MISDTTFSLLRDSQLKHSAARRAAGWHHSFLLSLLLFSLGVWITVVQSVAVLFGLQTGVKLGGLMIGLSLISAAWTLRASTLWRRRLACAPILLFCAGVSVSWVTLNGSVRNWEGACQASKVLQMYDASPYDLESLRCFSERVSRGEIRLLELKQAEAAVAKEGIGCFELLLFKIHRYRRFLLWPPPNR